MGDRARSSGFVATAGTVGGNSGGGRSSRDLLASKSCGGGSSPIVLFTQKLSCRSVWLLGQVPGGMHDGRPLSSCVGRCGVVMRSRDRPGREPKHQHGFRNKLASRRSLPAAAE